MGECSGVPTDTRLSHGLLGKRLFCLTQVVGFSFFYQWHFLSNSFSHLFITYFSHLVQHITPCELWN